MVGEEGTTGPRAASCGCHGQSREPLKIQRPGGRAKERASRWSPNRETRIVERDLDRERAGRGATGRARAPKAAAARGRAGGGITLGSGNTAAARLRATVVPVTESSDPSATLFPPPPLSQELLFYAPVLPLPRPLLLILLPPPLPPLTCCRPRSPARSQLSNLPNNVTSDNVASPISQHRRAFASARGSWQRRCIRPRHCVLLQTQPPMPPLSARLSYRYHSTTCTRCYRRQPLFHHRHGSTRRRRYFVVSFRTRGVSSPASSIDHVPTPNRRR